MRTDLKGEQNLYKKGRNTDEGYQAEGRKGQPMLEAPLPVEKHQRTANRRPRHSV